MGRTSDAKERLIESARDLMHDKGFEAVGVGEICSRARVNKGSFYHFFESKQRLGLAALDDYWAEVKPVWECVLQNSGGPPMSRIEKMMQTSFRMNRDAKETCGHVRGCMLGNLALEQSNQSAEVQARLVEIFNEQLALFESVLQEAAAEGTLREGVTPKGGARALLAYIEGMVMLAKLNNDPKLLRGMAAYALRMLAVS